MSNNIIINDGSKTLFLDFSYLQNVSYKENREQLNLIIEKMDIKNINTFDEFLNILRNAMLKSAFICLLDDKTRTVSKKKREDLQVYDAIVRIELNSDVQMRMPKETYLGFFVNINPNEPSLVVTSIFQTRLKPIVQDFETIISECDLQVINFSGKIPREEVLRRSILNSSTIGLIKKLQSNFEAERVRWENYLDFSIDLLNMRRQNSLPYLNCEIKRYLKVDEKKITPNLAVLAVELTKNLSFTYFEEKQKNLLDSKNIDYEEVEVACLDVLTNDNLKIKRLKKMSELSLVPFSASKNFPPVANLQKNFGEIFNFSFEKIRENNSTQGLNGLLKSAATKKNLKEYWLQKKEIIFGGEKELKRSEKEFSNELLNWEIYELIYELSEESNPLLFEKTTNVEKLKNGYLAFTGIGEDVLIDRCKNVLKRIAEGNIANPYLVNYLFNTKLVQLAENLDNIEISNLEFCFDLNYEQKEAVVKALNSKDIFMLQGPPGTGKTQVICEIIYQLSKFNRKILISSQNHEAINNVVNRLPYEPNINRVRLVNQLNLKSKEKNNFSPERVVYNYYKSIASRMFSDVAVQGSAINDLNEIENKLHQLINASKSFHQTKNQSRDLQDEIMQYKNKIAELQKKIINFKKNSDDIKNEIFYIELIINELKDLKFEGAVNISNKILEIYKKGIKFEMDQFTLNNFDRTIKLENFYSDLKSVIKLVILENEIYKSCKKSTQKIEQFKKEAEWGLAKQEEEVLQGLKKLLASETIFSECYKLIIQFISELENEKINLEYQIKNLKNDDNVEKQINVYNVKINELENKKMNLQDEAGLNSDSLRDLLKFTNQKYNLNLKLTDPDLDEIVKKELTRLQSEIKSSLKRKNDFQELFSSLQNYLKENYGIVDEKFDDLPTNKFTSQMILESKKYITPLMNKLVNVYGMTLTSSNYFKYTNNEFVKNLGLEEISLKNMDVDVVIVDEASKATLLEILMPLIYGKSLILVGDYRQLPPILKLQENEVDEVNEFTGKDYSYIELFELLDKSIFKNLISANNSSLTTMLKTQYRSHEQIMNIVNMFYDKELRVDADVSAKKHHELEIYSKHGQKIIGNNSSVYWIDSTFNESGEIQFEKSLVTSTSLFNELEIKLTVECLKLLDETLNAKQKPEKPTIAVISFYGLHVNKLKNDLKKHKFKNFNLVVNTVDDFQGKEADYVIVNMVRNPEHLGKREFLKKYERINVAFSRARELLIIIGAIRTVKDIAIPIPTVNDINVSNTRWVYADIIAKIENDNGLFQTKDIL